MPDYESVEYDVDDGAAWIRLDRPGKLNALNPGLLADLEAALREAESDGDARAVVLAGNGPAFSAGYDIGDDEEDPGTVEERLMRSRSHLDVIFSLRKPVIAAVDGPALAGGCNLALAPDLTFATERSEFGYPDMHFGEPPPKFVLPFVGSSLKYARELLYTGKTVAAAEAERMGYVNRVVPEGDLEATVAAEVDRIRKTPGAVVALTKEISTRCRRPRATAAAASTRRWRRSRWRARCPTASVRSGTRRAWTRRSSGCTGRTRTVRAGLTGLRDWRRFGRPADDHS